jgi:serine/threonine-protein kinase
LFQAALERASEDRSAFINVACGDDDSLRREVEALLAADGEPGSLIETPAYAMAAPLIAGGDAPTLLGKTIGHYQIISLVGKGGMGEVYRARDTKLDRAVALKILPEEMSADRERMRRFSREAKAASALNHPNVAHIYEIGEAEGVSFIAMEYVEGQTLAAKINGHPLAVSEIVEIGSQIADALDEAHGKGITHRDIKPANVMLNERGRVKVLNFGLAKITQPAAQPNAGNISSMAETEPGLVMGTAPYMSPEQALGREVDHRSDLFSLGVALYEMATGRLPFAGANTSETLDRILHSQPEAMARFNYDVPADLERIVRKCLEKEPERRYQSAWELLVDLKNQQRDSQSSAKTVAPVAAPNRSRRWLPIALAVTLLAAGGVALYLLLSRAQPKGQAIKSLAVLPLENLSGDPAQEYFADGMTEALISNLSQVRALRVISRTSVMRFKGSRKPLAEIPRELKVDAVIEGSVQRDGGRVKITARLIRAADEIPLRSFDYERELADVLKLQSEVARAVAGEIQIQVTQAERARLASGRRVDPEAHEAYLLGRYYWNKRTEEELKKGIAYFRQAVEKDPNYAAAYAGLADCHSVLAGSFGSPELYPKARAYAEKALALDGTLAEAHTTLAGVRTDYDWDFPAAEREFKRAIDLNASYPTAHQRYSLFLMKMGRPEDALTEIKRALALDPISLSINTSMGWRFYFARQYEQAIEQLRKTLDMDPNYLGARLFLGQAYTRQGKHAEAIAELNKAVESSRNRALPSLGYAYAVAGEKSKARQVLAELQEMSKQRYISPVDVASIYTGLGDKEQAFAWLEKGFQRRDHRMTFLKIEPLFEDLHSDSRWNELLRHMNFPE